MVYISKQSAKDFLKKAFFNLRFFISILIFVSVYSWLFGPKETLMGVAVNIAFTMFDNIDLGFDSREASVGIFLLFPFIGLMTYLSQFHMIPAVFIHFIGVYLLMLLTTAPLAHKTYMPFILCYIFAQSSPVQGREFGIRMAGLAVGGLLDGIVYYLHHRKKTYKRTYRDLLREAFKNSTRSRFVLRMTLGITAAATAGALLHVAKPMWISIVVMSLTQPFTHDTHERIQHRLVATVVGCIIFSVLFNYLIPPVYSTLALMVLGYIYMFVKEYKIQQVFVTINALAAAMILFDASTSIPMRITLLVFGIAIVLILNWVDEHVIERVVKLAAH